MKKIFIAVLSVLVFAVAASAQPKALGVRAGYGAEVSYQHFLGAENFLEADLGWTAGSISATGVYNFDLGMAGPFNFYAGPGAHLGLASETIAVAVAGQVGCEYEFPTIPLNISLDWRPAFYVVPATQFSWVGFALGIRYRF